MAATGMPLFYTDQQSHATSSYFSPVPTIGSNSSFSWNMAPHQDPNALRQRRSLSPRTVATDNNSNNGGGNFSFIVGNTPSEMKSKKHMTIVRKQAMQSFLKEGKKGDRRSRQSMEQSRLINEDSTGSLSSVGSRDAAIVDVANKEFGTAYKKGTGTRAKRGSTAKTPASHPIQQTSSLEAQLSTVRLPLAPIVVPMRDDRILDYDKEKTPLFNSLGKEVDPFKTMFQSSYPRVSVENLKFLCARFFGTRAMGQHWIPTVLSAPHTFLSTLCVASSHYDAILEREAESVETISLRQEIIHLVGQNVVHPHTTKKVDDLNMTALIQLIASEVIGREEGSLKVHEKGLETMINMRGGLNQLGVSGYLASTISWILLESAILRETQPVAIYSDYCAANSTKDYAINVAIPESPIYHPRRQFETLKRSDSCNEVTLELLNDIQEMIDTFLHQTKTRRRNSEALLTSYKKITTKYLPIAELREQKVLRHDDYKYEAIRLAAILQATAVLERKPLSEALPYAAAVVVSRNRTSPYTFPAASQSNENPASPLSPMNPYRDSETGFATSPTYPSNLVFAPQTGSYFDAPRSSVSSVAISHPSMSSTTSHPSISSVATSYPSTSSISTSWPFPPLTTSRPPIPSTHSSSNNPFYPPRAPATPDETTDLLLQLKKAISDSNMSDCWQNMGGVLLWIGLTVGAASRTHKDRVLKKWFSALAMRASITLCFEHPQAVHATMLKMGQVVEALNKPSSSSTCNTAESLARRDSEMPAKKRRPGN